MTRSTDEDTRPEVIKLAPSLGTRVLVMREITERPEAIESGWAELVGTSREAIVARASHWLAKRKKSFPSGPNPFGDGSASQKIAKWLVAHGC